MMFSMNQNNEIVLVVYTDDQCPLATDGHQTKDSNRGTHLLYDC